MDGNALTHALDATLLLVMWLSLPVLGVAAAVGLVVGLLQAVTQIQDQSLAQTLKLAAVLATVGLVGPLLGGSMLRHTRELLDQLPLLVH